MTQHYAKHSLARRAVATVASLLALLCAVFYASEKASAQDDSVVKLSPVAEYRFDFDKTVKQPVLSGVAIANGTLYVGGDDEKIYACPVESAPNDKNANIFDEKGVVKTNEWIRAVAASPTQNEIAFLSQNGGLAVLDLTTNKLASSSTQIAGAHALCYSPNGKVIAVCGYDPFVRFYDPATLTPMKDDKGRVKAWEAPSHSLTAVKFSPDGERIAVGGRSGVVRVWTTRTPPRKTEFYSRNYSKDGKSGALRRVRAIAFSPDNRLIAIGGDSNQIEVFEVETRERVAALTIPAKRLAGKVYSLAFVSMLKPGKKNQADEDQKYVLVSGDSVNGLRVWSVEDQRCLADSLDANAENVGSSENDGGHTGTISSILADGPTIYTTSFDTTVKRWDLTQYINLVKKTKSN